MAALRFSCLAGSLLILALAAPARSQDLEQTPFKQPTAESHCECSVAVGPIRKTYSLAEMGDDASFGAWIAEMIPQVVQPGTWNTGDAKSKHVLSYYAPAKMLLVYHTPAVHAEIDDFLRGMKKSLPTTKAMAKAPGFSGLSQMGYSVPAMELQSGPAYAPPAPATAPGYPVASPTQQPHHLFHFIIRYEGDGVIDRNVAEFAKAYGNAAAASATEAVNALPTAPVKSETSVKVVTPAGCMMPACPACATPETVTVRPNASDAPAPFAATYRSTPSVNPVTPAPAPSHPAPVTPPATPDDEKE